jgi:hypothetical protein
MSVERPRYVSYLLRLWQAEQGGALVWRASLEDAHTGERRGFATLAELYAFLEQATAAVSEWEPRSTKSGDVIVRPKAHPQVDGEKS